MESLLQRSESVHVVLNHVPIVGLGGGAAALAIALFTNSRGETLGCMVLALVLAASVWPVDHEYGHEH